LSQSATAGSLDRWLKQEGHPYKKGETLAEITLDGVTIGLQLKEPGVLVKHLLNEGQIAAVGDAMALVADSQEGYMEYLDDLRLSTEEQEDMLALDKKRLEAEAAKELAKSNVMILRHIKHMIQHKQLEDETGFSKFKFTTQYFIFVIAVACD
jgi:pyruvate/2-oxoglutarate dehydrogenase complex dihydrolipoamide acyltransferase (E2) component